MRLYRLLMLLCVCSGTIPGFSQTQNKAVVKGVVVDSVTLRPLNSVIVSILNKAEKVCSTVLTNEFGVFENGVAKSCGDYLSFRFTGYKSVVLSLKESFFRHGNLDTIKLAPLVASLTPVNVTAKKQIYKQEIDRVIFSVQDDVNSKNENGFEILKKAPFISVDENDNIQLKNSSSYKVFLDGKPSPVLTGNLRTALRSMSYQNISRIEIITNPPAKYDAEGLAGIINIVTLKRLSDGYNGIVSGNYSKLYDGLSTSLNVKSHKLESSVSLGNTWETSPITDKESRYRDLLTKYTSTETGTKDYNGRNLYANVMIGYEIDTLDYITVGYAGNFSRGDNRSTADVIASIDNSSKQSYSRGFNKKARSHVTDLSLNFQHTFKRHRNNVISIMARNSSSLDDQLSYTDFVNNYGPIYNDNQQHSSTSFHETTVQVDFSSSLKKGSFETGIKHISRNPGTNYFISELPGSAASVSSQFDFTQRINSGYLSYLSKIKTLTLKTGVRLELTDIDYVTGVQQRYTNLIPVISIQKALGQNQSLTVGYTERLLRPGINYLNPFGDLSDPRYKQVGNMGLVAVVNHNLEVGYSNFKKGFVNMSVAYAFSNNGVQNVFSSSSDSALVSTYANIGRRRTITLTSSVNYPVTKTLSFTLNGSISWVNLKGEVLGVTAENSGFQGFIFSYLSKRFSNNWRVSLNGGFTGAPITLQGIGNSFIYNSVSVSKDLFQSKLSLGLSVANPFQKYRKVRSNIQSLLFQLSQNSWSYVQNININAFYSFGKLKSAIRRTKKSISNDDKLSL